ncbi:hypothetical protein QYE76_006176 [Lolium multiflorum]|uniref:F-box domain-containing protein n=1 Tax=Lolium multiflorum TaxID=4521 RepID=A0AAD8W449_LOLMU|nr:hypothetical protein QYE76_006176 [Lolium multiflorum]
MGLLALERLLSVRRRRRQTQARGIPNASGAKREGSPSQQESSSQGGKRTRSSGPELPEDIWQYIHSLLPLRDAARASCVSRAFQSSWRSHPNLTFEESMMGLEGQAYIDKVDQIMKKHSDSGVKTFEFEYDSYFDTSQLNSWLKIAVTPGIEELDISLSLEEEQEIYNFPCLLLFAGSGGNSIRSLYLSGCSFRPMAGLGCLTRLHLWEVHITGDELGCLLSSSFALEQLSLTDCSEINCLKIPCLLHRLVDLTVSNCSKLEVIENKAPNLCTVSIESDVAHISIGDSLQVKELEMYVEFNLVYHARAKLPAIMPNLETLSITSAGEMFSTPSVPGKFHYLKHLDIHLEVLLSEAFSPNYDYFSLAYFLDACPILETFSLEVDQTRMKHDSVLEDPSDLRQIPGHRYDNIKKVGIAGFCSAKSMVELTCHILENATSLECLTLGTILYGYENRLSDHKYGKCPGIGKHMIAEAHKALAAIDRYVVGKVPSTVKLNVMKPCSRCHVLK